MLKLTPKPDPNAPKADSVNLPAGEFTPGLEYKKHTMDQNFFANLKDFFTERPVKVGKGSKDDAFAPVEFENGFADNFKEWFRGGPKAAGGLGAGAEPFLEIVSEAVLEFDRSEGVVLRAFGDLNGPLGKEVLQIVKEALRHRMLLVFQSGSEFTGRKIHGRGFWSVWVRFRRKFQHSYIQVPDGRIRYSVRYKPRGIVVWPSATLTAVLCILS